ncbi:MAG: hypothetical protein AAB393_05530, partial [Bacteroidota bacterium]
MQKQNTPQIRRLRKFRTEAVSPTRCRTLTRSILRWYSCHSRALPWRLPAARLNAHGGQGQAGNISNPYRILVSEVMLQQTQVNRVLEKYPRFLKRFPTIHSLARAHQHEVVIAWQGMGYNNRAVRLHQLARTVLQQHGGKFPEAYQELVALPGVGKYTANALLSSAFGKDVPVVDVNVRRVLSRLLWQMRTTIEMKPESEIWELAQSLLPAGKAYDWNQALMDLGATICTARAPQCISCPAARLCSSAATMKHVTSSPGKQEPSRDGVPNRIYRGRIIEALRQYRGRRRLHPDDIGKQIRPTYSSRDRFWLRSLLAGLERDGLIQQP